MDECYIYDMMASDVEREVAEKSGRAIRWVIYHKDKVYTGIISSNRPLTMDDVVNATVADIQVMRKL